MADITALKVLLQDQHGNQILPVSKSNLIELMNSTKALYGEGVSYVDQALSYLAATWIPAVTTDAHNYTDAELGKLLLTEVNDGKPIVSISQTDGKVAASTGTVDSTYITVTSGTSKYGANGGTVDGALAYILSEVESTASNGEITVTRSTTDNSYAAVYTISQGGTPVGDTINIPKDLVATNGTLVSSRPRTSEDGEGEGAIAGTYIAMTIANGDPFYIDVHDLIEYNSVADTDEIDLDDTSHTITATIKEVAASKISYYTGTEGSYTTAQQEISNLNNLVGDTSVSTQITNAVNALDSNVRAQADGNTNYVLTYVAQEDGVLTSYEAVALTDTNVAVTFAENNDPLAALVKSNETNPGNVKEALDLLATNIKAAQGEAVTSVAYTQNNSYVNVGNGTAIANNELTIVIDDSALGNAAFLSYTVVNTGESETFTLFQS